MSINWGVHSLRSVIQLPWTDPREERLRSRQT